MTTGMVKEENLDKQLEKQMGCMAGFLHIFDRQQILTGKRFYSTKRLPPITAVGGKSESEKFIESPVKPHLIRPVVAPSLERPRSSPLTDLRSPPSAASIAPETPPKSPLPLPIFELKEGTRSSWKFCKEAPRLSLDSRATVDAKGSLKPIEIRTNAAILSCNRGDNAGDEATTGGDEKQRRSTSVIARLMGLEPLPHSSPEPEKKAELRRSASESRVSRDIFHYRFIDANNLPHKQQHKSQYIGNTNGLRDNNGNAAAMRPVDEVEYSSKDAKSELRKASNRGLGGHPWKSPQQRRSFFDSSEIFPEAKQNMILCGEIERRLNMRGFDEPTKDLETLKQILEALQLKGLLHSAKPSQQINHRNIVYNESPIVVMQPWRPPVSPINRRVRKNSAPSSCRSYVRLNLNLTGETLPTVSPRRERPGIDGTVQSPTRARNSSSPTRSDSGVKQFNSTVKVKQPPSVETSEATARRVSPFHSHNLNSKKFGSDQTGMSSRSPRNKKPTAEIHPKGSIPTVNVEDESSESAVSTPSQTDTERSKIWESKESRSILERCDKLLHSIAEITASDMQPSPVSVLESSFYKDESSSPSPVMKRSIDFEELEEDIWSPSVFSSQSKYEDGSEDCDFVYISKILRASNYLPEDSDVFLLLEKQNYLKGKDTSEISRIQRKLIFDTITEILDRNRQLPPWKVYCWTNTDNWKPSLQDIWSEFQRIRERNGSNAEGLFEIICGVLRKDLADDAINGWVDCPMEMSETVLDIERLVFKDLVGETIRDLAAIACKSKVLAPRKKLVF